MYARSFFNLFISAHKCTYSSDFKVVLLANRPGCTGLIVPCAPPSVELGAVVARGRARQGVQALWWQACPRSAPRRLAVRSTMSGRLVVLAPKVKAVWSFCTVLGVVSVVSAGRLSVSILCLGSLRILFPWVSYLYTHMHAPVHIARSTPRAPTM